MRADLHPSLQLSNAPRSLPQGLTRVKTRAAALSIGGIHDPRCFVVLPPAISMVLVNSAGGKQKLVAESEVLERLNQDYFLYKNGDALELADKTLFKENLYDIYLCQLAPAIQRLESVNFTKPEKELFYRCVKYAIEKKSDINHFRHYTFMIDEASKNYGTYLTAASLMLHNFDSAEIRKFCVKQGNKRSELRKAADALEDNCEKFRRLMSLKYKPYSGGINLRYFVQNMLNACLCLVEGNGHALLMRFVHRYSSLVDPARLKAKDDFRIISTRQLHAPQAHRLGLWRLAANLYDMAFRAEKPELHAKIRKQQLEWIGFKTESEAEEFLGHLELTVRKIFSENTELKALGLVSVHSRLKTPFSIFWKILTKPHKYEKVSDMMDHLGLEIVTKQPLPDKATLYRLIEEALSSTEFWLDQESEELEEKAQIDRHFRPRGMKHHLPITDGKRYIEIQLMDESAYKILTHEEKAHWAYKVKAILARLKNAVQSSISGNEVEFDFDEIDECGKLMTGNFFADAKILYEYYSSKWVYVFLRGPLRSGEEIFRVIRRTAGALPIEAAIFKFRGDLRYYGGTLIRKIWEPNKNRQKVAETRPLQTGDFLGFYSSNRPFGYLTAVIAKGLLKKVGNWRAKMALRDLIVDTKSKEALIEKGKLILQRQFSLRSKKMSRTQLDRLQSLATAHDLTLAELYLVIALESPRIITIDQILKEIL